MVRSRACSLPATTCIPSWRAPIRGPELRSGLRLHLPMWRRRRRRASHDIATKPRQAIHLIIDRALDWLLQLKKRRRHRRPPKKQQSGRNVMSQPASVSRRSVLTMLGGSVAAPLIAPHMASAQEAWPTRQVRYVNGFPAGGATDTLSRILCQKMSDISGQSFIVENKGSAGGVLGAAPALTDLRGARSDLLSANLPGSLRGVRAGQTKPLAGTATARIPELPDVPAMAEVLPGYAVTSWAAMVGPANITADVVAQINGLTAKALADPALKTRYSDLGATPWPASSAEIRAFRDSEEKRLLPIMKAAGVKPE